VIDYHDDFQGRTGCNLIELTASIRSFNLFSVNAHIITKSRTSVDKALPAPHNVTENRYYFPLKR